MQKNERISKKIYERFFDFMNFSETEANKIIDKFRSPHLWKKVGDKWKRLQKLKEIIR